MKLRQEQNGNGEAGKSAELRSNSGESKFCASCEES
jgi:hypothetical protein